MEVKMKSNRSFKNYLIDPKFQLKFVATILATNIFVVLMVLGSMYLFFINSASLFGVLKYMHSETSVNFRTELNEFFILQGWIFLLFIILIGFAAIIISHSAAGAMYRFKKVCDKITEGNLEERIILRPHDDFQNAAASFNKMMDQITKKN